MKKQGGMKEKRNFGWMRLWERGHRASIESVRWANGWLKIGFAEMTDESSFFYPGILH